MNNNNFLNIKFILIIVVTFLVLNINAMQPQAPLPKNVFDAATVDSGNIRIYYALNADNLKEQGTYYDLECLEIGSNMSKFYSRFVFNSDSLCIDWVKKNPKAESAPGFMGIKYKDYDHWSEYRYSEFFKDFSTNTLFEYSRMPFLMGKANAYYEENMPVFDWEIDADTLTVMNYLCQKATCHFRGRDFTAWFTVDIPVNNGPWKFSGLPGLILKIYDNDNLYIFECVKTEFHKKKFPIYKYNDYSSYKKTEREKLLMFQKKIHENYLGVLGAVLKDYKPEKIVYHPLELE